MQTSPFLPGDYEDSCLPVCLFEWVIENESEKIYDISIAFTFKNGWGAKEDKKRNAMSESLPNNDTFKGRMIRQACRGLPLTYAIGAKMGDGIQVKEMSDFDPDGDGGDFLEEFLQMSDDFATENGCFCFGSSKKNVGVAVQAKCVIKPGPEAKKMTFGLCWDMPKIKFRSGLETWKRFYTRFFPENDSGLPVSARILNHAFDHLDEWTEKIVKWQMEILDDPGLPDWFKSAVFNEMYYIADGGTQWLDFENKERYSFYNFLEGSFSGL